MAPPYHPRLLVCLPLLWAGLQSHTAWALDRNRSIAQHALDEWTSQEGLPRNSVEAVTQTPDGLLWLATSDGLTRLEGGQFRTWTQRDFPRAAAVHTNALAAGAEPGVLWLGTEGSGLIRFDYHTGAYELFREAEGLCDDNIESLALDQSGRLWIGTQSALACSFQDGTFMPFPLPERGAKSVVDIATDKTGGVYMAALTDALLYAPPRAEKLQSLTGLPGPASAVLVDEDGAVFVGTAGFGVFQYLWDQSIYLPIAQDKLGGASVKRLERDEQGVLWVGTSGHGVFRVRLDDDRVSLERDHIEAPLVTDLLADREGSLWITSRGYGVKRLVDHRLYTISERHGLADRGLLTLTESPDGDILVGTGGGGIYRLQGTRAEPLLPPGTVLDNAEVVSMHQGAHGVLWAGLDNAGVARIEGDQISLLGIEDGLADHSPSVVFEDREGGVWIGHSSGVLDRLLGEERWSYGADSGLPGQAITAITQRQDGAIWIGTRGGGVAALDNGRFRLLTSSNGLGSDNVNAIHETGNGSLWFSTSAGLTRYANGEMFSIGRDHGLPAGAVYDMTEDRRGNLWLATDKGIVALVRTQLAALVGGQIETLTAQLYDHTSGMLTSECSGAHQQALLKSSNSVIYAATTHGLVVVEPDREMAPRDPAGVVLTGLGVDGVALALPDPQDRPRLGRGQHDVTFSFLSTSNLHPRATRYRYRLAGLEESWVETSTTRQARYPALSPGRYSFEVQASYADDWTGPVTRQSFRLTGYPWHWTWLWLLLLPVGGIAAVTRQRRTARRNADDRRKLEAELDAKARELRDAALVDPLTGLRNRRFVMEVILPEVVAFTAQKVQIQQQGTQRRSTAETGVYGVFLFDIDHFKTINDTLGHEAGDRMLQQFSYLLRRSVRQDDFVVRWGGEEFLVVLRFSDRDHLDQYARRVREQVERTTFLVSEAAGGALKKTASLGYVSVPFFDEEPSLLEFEHALLLADQALYHAKESGRNRAVRAVSTGKIPQPGELRQMVRDLDWAIANGFASLESFAGKD